MGEPEFEEGQWREAARGCHGQVAAAVAAAGETGVDAARGTGETGVDAARGTGETGVDTARGAGETGVDAAKGGRTDVIDPSAGQVAPAVPAADETVTAARRELALVCAPPVGTAPALYVDARPARTRPRVGRTAAMPPGQALHRPDPQRRSAPPTPGVAETSTATPGLVSLVPPTAAGAAETPTATPSSVPLIPADRPPPPPRRRPGPARPSSPCGRDARRESRPGPARPCRPAARAAETPTAAPAPVPLIPANRRPCGRNTARDSRPLSHSSPPTGHRRRRDAGPGPARPRQPAARAAGT
ncbi:hypothetical protein AB0392_41790, partial [Nonomuraea angiospora]